MVRFLGGSTMVGDGIDLGFLRVNWYFGKVVMEVMGVRYGKGGLNGVEDKGRSEG